jgi:cell division septum initiation protein DivIVA
MAELTAESIAEHKVTNEKHKQIKQSIDSQDDRINEITKSVNSITTEIIPEMQKCIDQNSLTSKVFWKFLVIAGTPICGGIGSILFVFQKAQESNNTDLAKALAQLAATMSGAP